MSSPTYLESNSILVGIVEPEGLGHFPGEGAYSVSATSDLRLQWSAYV